MATAVDPLDVLMPPETLRQRIKADGQLWREALATVRTGPSPREFAAALRTPVPNAAMVSAVVAAHWHRGLAEDAWRRAEPWVVAEFMASSDGGRDEHAENLAMYFTDLATMHHDEAQKLPLVMTARMPRVFYV